MVRLRARICGHAKKLSLDGGRRSMRPSVLSPLGERNISIYDLHIKKKYHVGLHWFSHIKLI